MRRALAFWYGAKSLYIWLSQRKIEFSFSICLVVDANHCDFTNMFKAISGTRIWTVFSIVFILSTGIVFGAMFAGQAATMWVFIFPFQSCDWCNDFPLLCRAPNAAEVRNTKTICEFVSPKLIYSRPNKLQFDCTIWSIRLKSILHRIQSTHTRQTRLCKVVHIHYQSQVIASKYSILINFN